MSVRCTTCGTENQDRARFCMHCSGPLMQACPSCGATATVTARFCQQCGATLNRLAGAAGMPPASKLTGFLQPAMLLAGRYRIVQKLGEGGMAAVYLTEDLRLTSKQWAVKEMTDAALTNTSDRLEAVQAFRQEAEMLAKLDHPNLPKVVDYFSENSNQYLVMEYIQGQTLEERLRVNRSPLPESQIRVWAEKLCQVLAYLHNQRPPIIFRDLKPSNIMVRTDDELKLIDFGIARHFKPGQSKDTQAFGTVGFAPPEQHGKGQTDVRSDIYALGATLHYLLTAQDPSSNPFTFERVRRLNATVSPTLEEVIAKAVEIKPDLRWQSMEQMRQALAIQPVYTPVASVPTPPPQAGQGQAAIAPTVLTSQPAPPLYPPASHLALQPLMNYAGYGKRVGAYLIDGVILGIFFALLYLALLIVIAAPMQNSGSSPSEVDAMVSCLQAPVILLAWFFYYLRPTAQTGQTFGKRRLGIRVVDRTGQPPNLGHVFLRYIVGYGVEVLLMYVLIGVLGLLWPLWDAQKQTWHDKIAGTFVVEE